MNGNRVFCRISNLGPVCDSGSSAVVGGGFWPKDTPDQYIFSSGLQIAGVIPADGRFAWSGDTVGAWFFDPIGVQLDGAPITPVFNSLDPADLATWPAGAVVWDTTVYSTVSRRRNTISQQDLWLRTWDGVPDRSDVSRPHPMGIVVEERGLTWNYPVGAEDLVYFVYTFYNVTAKNAAVYDGLDPAIRGEIAELGQEFQARNEAAYGIDIPDDGYPITAAYVAFSIDPDVGDAARNYATPVIPFAMGVAYKSDFLEPRWTFPVDIFSAPFVSSPGFVGVKYLRSPRDSTGRPIGLTIFSTAINAAATSGYPDPFGVKQLYRYLSGTSSPATGDGRCTYQGEQRARHICFLADVPTDLRFFQSSGPLILAPGQHESIVVAYIFAAPTDTVVPYIGGDFNPGQHPATGADLARDGSLVRPIERAMGWLTQQDADGNGEIAQDEVRTLPRSLLYKAQVAQAVFDSKFLLPFAPEPPRFFLVPGDNQVTVVWEKSASESVRPRGGDPFFELASDPTAALYDPNFRQYDVEGYRIYRGRSTGDLRLIAQFDYAGTTISDFTGAFAYTEDLDGDGIVRCAPELGLQQDCPTAFESHAPFLNRHDHAIVGPVIQVPTGGRVALADSSVLITSADTAVTGAASDGFPALTDAGVPFSFVDRGARNAFDYYYAVTAFDLNSLRSGPSSIESTRNAKPVTPRAGSGQEIAGYLGDLELIGSDGSVLVGSDPTLDATSGRFSGPSAPTNGLSLGLVTFLPELLSGKDSISLTLDSVAPGAALNGIAAIYYVTAQGSGSATALAIPVPVDPYGGTRAASGSFPATHVDPTQASRFGDSSATLYGSTAITTPGTWRLTSWGRGSNNADPVSADFNGPRWFAGNSETQSDPNGSHCRGSPGACVAGVGSGADTAFPGLTHTAGALPGVDTIFHVLSYNTVPDEPQRQLEGITATVTRAADIAVHWGAAGKIDSVVDRTHHVAVPFRPTIGASWGILNDSSFILGGPDPATTADGSNNLLTWADDFCVDPAPRFTGQCGGAAQHPALLMDHARLSPVAAHAATLAGTANLTAGGNGFTLYLNGHFFLMQLATLPAAGTVWTCRFYAGSIIGSPRHYAFLPAVRPPAVPGLRARISYTGSVFDPSRTTAANLARVHTVPDPYYVSNALESSTSFKVLKFVNLPAQAIVRIYSLSGVLIAVLTHNDPAGGGELAWNLRTRNNQFVASGVYFYHVETPDRRSTVGRFTVVSFAP
jgi:hypothetical protein